MRGLSSKLITKLFIPLVICLLTPALSSFWEEREKNRSSNRVPAESPFAGKAGKIVGTLAALFPVFRRGVLWVKTGFFGGFKRI